MLLSIQAIPWMVIVVLLPLLGAVACFLWQRRSVPLGLVTGLGILFSVAGLGWQLHRQGVQQHALGGWGAPLGVDLYADGLSLLMLSMTALVGLGISTYASGYFDPPKAKHFWPLWLLLWAALNALFLSADIFNLYVTLELLGLAAVALAALAGGADALAAAMRYLLVSLLGSLAYLFGVALLYHSFGSVDMTVLSQRMEATPAVWTALGLMSGGLLLKTALFPLHFWLPPAHASSPAPVSALLSALVVKGSFYILLRLWLVLFPSTNGMAGELLAALGATGVLWGGVQALRQTRLKMMIAYSTVAQVGYLFLAFSMATNRAWQAMLILLLAHALGKSAMFMAAGNILRFGGHDRIADLDRVAQRLPLTITAFGLAGVSIMGLPPSGGFIGKWLLLEATLRSGQWWWTAVILLGGLLAAAYVFRVLGYAFTQATVTHETRAVPASMEWTAVLLAVAAILLGFIGTGTLVLSDIGAPFGGEPVE